MAKRAPKKKINRRTRRLIRRSIAAVLMITAIGVAAIPVPDIQADDGSAGMMSRADSNEKREKAVAAADASTTRVRVRYPNPDDIKADYDNLELTGPGGILDGSIHPDPTDPDDDSNMIYGIRQNSDKEWDYNWQFKFYTLDDNSSIVKSYNNNYNEKDVTLHVTNPLRYYTVPVDKFTSFYAEGGDGNREFTLSYNDYVVSQTTGSWGDKWEDQDFFNYYYSSEYRTFINECQARDKDPTKPVGGLSKNPAQAFNQEKQYQYYCDCNFTSNGTNFIGGRGELTLVYANDYAHRTGAVIPHIYLVRLAPGKNNSDFTGNGKLDDNGFVSEAQIQISGIANKAFQGVTTIDTLVLPEEINYIGDNAFEDSFIKNINFTNVAVIGNQAFKNCKQLTTVTIGSGVQYIGAEAFSGSPNITSITIPYSIRKIGAGAFSYCTGLKSVDMSATSAGNESGVEIGNYAFFDCYSLDKFVMGGVQSGITKIGDGAFATTNADVASQGNWDTVVLPSGINEDDLGQWLFAGRTNLKSVTFPTNYGDDEEVTVPDNMFMGCVNLKEVIFPDTCGYVKYDPYLFLDVIEPDLVVSGPQYNEMLSGNQFASPRRATWEAVSAVSDYIPYKYKDKRTGLDYYEVSDGTYLLTANQNGALTSCTLIDKDNVEPFDLLVPDYVGNYKITSIDTNCFTEPELRDNIRSITIADNSISEISDGTFRDLPILEKVVIGNSVKKIGNSAFEGCKKLVDVWFNPPAGGDYAGFTIGTNAFLTGSDKLTFHGDIKENYAPYDWAMNPDNYMDKDLGKRVCYKSLSPSNLTVLYNNSTGERTLVDYPKYARLDKDNKDFLRSMENTYYLKYQDPSYDDIRYKFYKDWLNNGPAAYQGDYYGPWVNSAYINSDVSDGETIGWGESGDPEPYFTKYPYSIIENYEHPGNTEWRSLTPVAEAWVNSALRLVVPAGIDSIDVTKYMEDTSNRYNLLTYLGRGEGLRAEDYDMYALSQTDDKDNVDSIPGLFSGLFKDFDEETSLEKKYRGNDRLEEVTLESITYLPDYAFDSCENLKKVTIGPACEDIGTAPFRGCDNLEDVVFQNNDKYTSNKGIIYSVNDDGTYTIEECLPYRGMDSISAPPLINLANDPDLANVSAIKEGAFEDCNNISAVDLRDTKNLTTIPEKAFKNCKILSQVYLPATVDLIKSEAFNMDIEGERSRITVTIPGREVHIATDAFQHTPTAMIRSYVDSAAHEYADYHGLAWEDLAETFQVIFMDWDGSIIGDIQYVETDKNAVPPEDPVREGYTFVGWSADYLGITKDTICLAQYRLNGTVIDPNDPNNPGGSKDPNDPDNPDGNISDGKSYNVTVVNGSGGGSYLSGSTVRITANTPASGQRFSYWSSPDGVRFADANSATTTFTMPTKDVTVTANYTSSSNNGSNGSGNGNGNGSTVSGNNKNDGTGSSVVINRPGFNNTDLASATVNGSTDNFIVRITETAEATRAVEAALTAEYGSLENIRYFAMDITLWDSTGTVKITDTTGITVDITIPIPTDFVNFGGNNKTAGVVNDRLDKLSPKFTTIDGVSCVTFRATHFSPYAIYVDVTNLSEGSMLDSTPKTGDGIHPKWFLAVGLASVSVVLFLKKDKKQAGRRTKLA